CLRVHCNLTYNAVTEREFDGHHRAANLADLGRRPVRRVETPDMRDFGRQFHNPRVVEVVHPPLCGLPSRASNGQNRPPESHMLRRILLISALGAWPAVALGQTQPPARQRGSQPATITPQTALEYAFVSALTTQNMRPICRRYR